MARPSPLPGRATAAVALAARGCARASSTLAPAGDAKKEGRESLSAEEEDSGGSRAWEEEDTERGNIFSLRSERR